MRAIDPKWEWVKKPDQNTPTNQNIISVKFKISCATALEISKILQPNEVVIGGPQNVDVDFVTPFNFRTWVQHAQSAWHHLCRNAEISFKARVASGIPLEQAYASMPMDLLCDFYVTGSIEEWLMQFKKDFSGSRNAIPMVGLLNSLKIEIERLEGVADVDHGSGTQERTNEAWSW